MDPLHLVTLVTESVLSWIDPKTLIATFGLIGVWVVLFSETGLLVGFFLPGDTLLFLAGITATTAGAKEIIGEPLNLPALLIGSALAAIAGAQVGHYIGAKTGRRLFERKESRLFRKEHVLKAEYYFLKFGPGKAVILARFIPIVRTFLNPVAGILEMPAKRFLLWNVIGGLVWTQGVIMSGYLLGDLIPPEAVDKYLLPLIGLLVAGSVVAMLLELMRGRRRGQAKEPVGKHSR